MSTVRSVVGAVLRRVPGWSTTMLRLRRRHHLRRILASGVFDRDWYERQAGRTFGSDAAAVQHYLRSGRGQGLSPNPLFEPAWYERKRWRSLVRDPLAVYLARVSHQRTRSTHLLFDPVLVTRAYPEAEAAPFGPLGYVLTAGPEVTLPLDGVLNRPGTVRLDRVREQLDAALDSWLAQERLRLAPRRTAHFDAEGSRRFLAGLAGVRPEPVDGGGPLVSVVMPVWNRAASVRRAVESVQAQTLGDWELVVVDDGSSDDTPGVLEGLAHFEPRLRVFRQERGGVSAARNRAIDESRGRYVAFLDSDNTWDPDFLRVMAAVMQRDDLSAAYSAMRLRHGAKVSYRAFDGGREHLLVGNHIDLNILVVRADLLAEVGGFSTDLRRAVDYDLVLKLGARAELRYVPFIGAVYSEDGADGSRISVRESVSWNYVVRARHALDWTAARQRPRVAGRMSVVIPVGEDVQLTRRCITHLLLDADGAGLDVEILLIGIACSRSATMALASLSLADPRVRLLRQPVDLTWALAVDTGLAAATGEFAVACRSAVVAGAGLLGALHAQLSDPAVAAVQPAVTGPDGTLIGAGATFTAGADQPILLLDGHPAEDVRALGPVVDIPALSGPVWAARTADLLDAHGLDCVYLSSWSETDLSLRLARDGHGGIRLVTGPEVQLLLDEAPAGSVAASGTAGAAGVAGPAAGAAPPRIPALTPADAQDDILFHEHWTGSALPSGRELWERSGFAVAHHRMVCDPKARTRRLRPIVVRPARTVADGPAAGMPALRWALKIAAPAGPAGRLWGDWGFARSLATALRRLGQDVVIDVRESRERETTAFDDVNLVLRGLDVVDPDEAKVQLLWVISHPDLVTPDELRGYDRVLAASALWSRRVDARFGIAVEPLLQCTDATVFRPDVAEPDTGARTLFVGNSRGVYRQAVRYALDAGCDLEVYGKGWEPFLPEGVVRGLSVPAVDLPAAYASAGVVLNDHWDDMRVEGFISNRVFDVTAVGGRLLTDAVDGLDDVFGKQVRTWTSPQELAALLRADPDEVLGDRASRLALAEQVRREHSFDARARRLLEIAVASR
ncbi:MAG: glycosyltransferase [Kineosporiaceae bacterium]